MRILITGGAGFLGRRLGLALLEKYSADIESLTIFDRMTPADLPADDRLKTIAGDITDEATVQTLIKAEPTHIFHLAAVVSGEAEKDFDLGMRVNLIATQAMLEACRQLTTPPIFIMTSSVAVFGGDMPDVIVDGTAPTPQSSYGTQKAICELLVNDYSRRGFVDGRVLRVPTVVVRAGKPNAATSSFASGIIREPLNGERAICPISAETALWLMSPRQAVWSLLHALTIPADAFGSSRTISLPGLTVTVQGMVDSLRSISGSEVADRIDWLPDPFIERIVGSWPARFQPTRALELGFSADVSFDDIVRSYIEDEMN
ncbi:MAG: nucleoside-diphosphate-sugar epimerase [Cellvibrionaceae bacterium]|jgi:nucleoside-diphosphate-sugar epimerase